MHSSVFSSKITCEKSLDKKEVNFIITKSATTIRKRKQQQQQQRDILFFKQRRRRLQPWLYQFLLPVTAKFSTTKLTAAEF